MDANWPKVKELFAAALELDAAERLSFLSNACPNDERLRQEVIDLLAADGASGSFMNVQQTT